MQIQFEAQIVDCANPWQNLSSQSGDNRSLESYALLPNCLSPIELLASSPASNLIAAYSKNANQIILITAKGRRERFSLKACDKRFSRQSFTVRGLDFSPDGCKLAVGQSDCIIYIYKLPKYSSGDSKSDTSKPTITGKFVCSAPITCLIWIDSGIIFGTQDAKVKLIQTNSSSAKVSTLASFAAGSVPVSLTSKPPALVVGLIDGTLHISLINTATDSLEVSANDVGSNRRSSNVNLSPISHRHTCPPFCTKVIQNNVIICAGSNGQIFFYAIHPDKLSISSEVIQKLDLREEINSLDYSSTNEAIVVASLSRLVFLKLDQETNLWQIQSSSIKLHNSISIASVAWIRDGSQLFAGSLNGALVSFSCNWSKQSVSDQVDICHIAKNRVRIIDRARNLLATYKTRADIRRVNLLDKNRSVIIWTINSVLVARLDDDEQLESEIPSIKDARFRFDYDGFVLIERKSPREILVVELGSNDPLFTIRMMDSMSRRSVCIRRHPAKFLDGHSKSGSAKSQHSSEGANESGETGVQQKRLAYISDKLQLTVINLTSNANRELSYRHSCKIESVDLSYTTNYVIFKDELEQLFLIKLLDPDDLRSSVRAPLIEKCSYSDWIKSSDILVTQTGHQIKVWYDMNNPNSTDFDCRALNPNRVAPILDLNRSIDESKSPSYPYIKQVDSKCIKLTNGQSIALDTTQIRFHTEILRSRLDVALDNLRGSDFETLKLLNKLAWLALERRDCQVAMRAFQRLKYNAFVDYLSKCLETSVESSIKLAKFMGDWDEFERLTESEEIISTYRRMHKYHRVLDYLTKTQQFRQRDAIEAEFRDWLVERRRFKEAAISLMQSGDLQSSLELLIKHERAEDVPDLLSGQNLPTSGGRLKELAHQLKNDLLKSAKYGAAAVICDRLLGDQIGALELYIKGCNFEEALKLAGQVSPERQAQIQEAHGDNLLNERRAKRLARSEALQAIEKYLTAQKHHKALAASIELSDFASSLEILSKYAKDFDEAAIKSNAHFVGSKLVERGQLQLAARAFSMGGYDELEVQTYLKLEQFEKAFAISNEKIHNSNKAEAEGEFLELANTLRDSKELAKAERIYLMLHRHEYAIEMYKEVGQFERMLELISKWSPDALEGSLIQLARELENSGDLAGAEKFMLQASDSEWTNVVRMYRLHNKWADAFRVAKDHSASDRDPLLVQLAYWWCKSLASKEEAADLLKSLGLLNFVVEFACENKNFQFAIDICKKDPSSRRLLDEIVMKYATLLEQQHKFELAEQVLLEANLIDEAIRMYIDNDMHPEAIRVAEQLGGASLLNKTLLKSAERLVEEAHKANGLSSKVNGAATSMLLSIKSTPAGEKYLRAQQMYLRAQRPDLAVDMYKSVGLWQEAIQVAQRFAPQLLENVERALDCQVSSDLAPIIAAQQQTNSAEQVEKSSTRSSSTQSSSVRSDSSSADTVASFRAGKSNRSSSRADNLKFKVDQIMRTGDSKAIKSILNEFLEALLSEGNFDLGDYRRIHESLLQFESIFSKSDPLVNCSEHANQLITLADKIGESCIWGQVAGVERRDQLAMQIWIKLRNVLLICFESISNSSESTVVQAIERRLMMAHFVAIHNCLVSEALTGDKWSGLVQVRQIEQLRFGSQDEVLKLLAQVSVCLVKFSDILEVGGTLYTAGLWLLAVGRPDLSRLFWSQLMDLSETAHGQPMDLKLPGALLPSSLCRSKSGKSLMLSSSHMSIVRAWLLENLIEISTAGKSSSSSSKFGSSHQNIGDEGLELEQLQQQQADRLQDACLLCGMTPEWANEADGVGGGGGGTTMSLGVRLGRTYKVHCEQLRLLQSLRRRLEGAIRVGNISSKQQQQQPAGGIFSDGGARLQTHRKATRGAKLADIIDFLARLSGSSVALDDQQ